MNDEERVGVRWTKEEDEKLIEEINNKKSYDEIAIEHKRKLNGIKSRVITNIIYNKYKEETLNNIDNISSEYNIESDLIKKYIGKLIVNNKEDNNNKSIKDLLLEIINKLNDIDIKLDKFRSFN